MSIRLTDEAVKCDMILRRARKAHKCSMLRPRDGEIARKWDGGPIPADHTADIAAGSQYVEYCGEVPAYQSGDRFCAGCARAAGLATDV